MVRLAVALFWIVGGCGDNAVSNAGTSGGGAGGAGADTGGTSVGGGDGVGGSHGSGGTLGTLDAGASGGATTIPPDAAPSADANGPPPGSVPVIVAVGWSGLRIASRDLGKVWIGRTVTTTAINSEYELLRGVAFGEGLFVAVGIDRYYSADGINWKKGNSVTKAWLGQVAYGNGMFVGAGNGGIVERSLDGINWEETAHPSKEHLRAVAFDGRKFAVSGNEFKVYVSTDGLQWTPYPSLSTYEVTYCDGALKARAACPPVQGFGFWFQCNGTAIERSDDGKTAWKAFHYDANRFVGAFSGMAFGYAPK